MFITNTVIFVVLIITSYLHKVGFADLFRVLGLVNALMKKGVEFSEFLCTLNVCKAVQTCFQNELAHLRFERQLNHLGTSMHVVI